MKTKKPVIYGILVCFLLTTTSVRSQVLLGLIFGDKLNSKESIFGIHIDYSWNSLSSYSDADPFKTFNFGLFYNYKFNENFRANADLMAKYTRGVAGLPVYDLGDNSLNELFGEGEISREIHYFSLPIGIQYLTKPGIFLEIGPQVSLRLKAKDIITADNPEGGLELDRNIKDEVSTFDFGWYTGIGYYIDKGRTFALGVRYYGGFSDVLEEQGSQQHRQWAVYANIPIGRKKLNLEE